MKINIADCTKMFCYTSNERVEIFDFDNEQDFIEFNRWLVTCPNVISKMEKAIFSTALSSLVHSLREFDVGERVAITYGSSTFYIHIPKDEFMESVGGSEIVYKEALFAKIVIEAFLADYVLENYVELICEHQEKNVGVDDASYDPDFNKGTDIPLHHKLKKEDKLPILLGIYKRKEEFFSLFQAYHREYLNNPSVQLLFGEKIPNLKEVSTGNKYYDSYCGFDNLISPSDADFDTVLSEVLSDEQKYRLEKRLRLFDKGSLVRSFSTPNDFSDSLYCVLREMSIWFVSAGGHLVIEGKETIGIESYVRTWSNYFIPKTAKHYSFYFELETWDNPIMFAIDDRTNERAFSFNVFDFYCSPYSVLKKYLPEEIELCSDDKSC